MRRVLLVLLIGYWIALFVGTHWPQLPHFGVSASDKILHFAAYAGLAVLMTAALCWGRPAKLSRPVVIFLVLCVYGAFDEITQMPIRGRTADRYDWYMDVLGALVGVVLGSLMTWALIVVGQARSAKPGDIQG